MAGDPPALESNEEAQDAILAQLSSKMQNAFKLLQDGKPKTRTFLAQELNYDSTANQGFKKLLTRIKAQGFLDFVDKESVQLADVCFPNGRD